MTGRGDIGPTTTARRRAVATALAAVLAVVGSALAVGPAVAATGPGGDTFGAVASAQLSALESLKASATPAERKLDSHLLLATRQRHDRGLTAALPRLDLGVAVSAAGTTTVDLSVTAVTPALTSRLTRLGAVVTGSWPAARQVRVVAPLDDLTTVAGWPDVRHVAPPVGARTGQVTDPRTPAATESPSERRQRLAAALQSATSGADASGADASRSGAGSEQGSVVSEGDRAEGAAQARRHTGVTGVGTKVCVLSTGVDSLAASRASGDLPDVDVLPGQAGTGDEGTAMLEIVHDLAPHATLGFATGFGSEAQFAQNIHDLRAVAGCDVLVDDVLYYDESPFQDGPLAQAVDAVVADGAVYVSSAGNDGNVVDGTTGNYGGDYVDSHRRIGRFAGGAHDFDPGPGTQIFEPLSAGSAGAVTTLFWSDPLGGARTDFDLYVVDPVGDVVALSQNVQDGDDDPFESLVVPRVADLRLAVVKFSGPARYLQVTAFGGRFVASSDGLRPFVTPGVTRGHSAAVGAISVGAAPAATALPFDLEPGDPPNPTGPAPDAFTRDQEPERFTSDGPRRVFFSADGSPLTPGDLTSTGGVVRPKPDLTAADGVSTSVSGFMPYFGTSAAAPHAAAVAALVLSGNPGASPAFVRNAMLSTAISLRTKGSDSRSGRGILRADRVLAATGSTPQPLVTAGTVTVTAVGGDGDAYLEPGETGTLSVPVTNTGDGPADAVSVRVTSRAPGVTFTPDTRPYGAVAAGRTVRRSFSVTLPKGYPNGRAVPLRITVTFPGHPLSPTSTAASAPTGRPSAAPTVFSYAGPPVPIPDASTAGVSIPLSVSGVRVASSVQLSVDGTACTTTRGATTVGIDHAYVGDLTGVLTAPNGASARLFAQSGTSGRNLCQVVFDDRAPTPFASLTSEDAPFTGTWAPLDPFGPLLAGSADGTWTFTLSDAFVSDTGTVRAFSLRLDGFDPPAAP